MHKNFLNFIWLITLVSVWPMLHIEPLFSQTPTSFEIKQIPVPSADYGHIQHISMDSSGVLWIGTQKRLYLYDGIQILPFPMDSFPVLSAAFFLAVKTDERGTVQFLGNRPSSASPMPIPHSMLRGSLEAINKQTNKNIRVKPAADWYSNCYIFILNKHLWAITCPSGLFLVAPQHQYFHALPTSKGNRIRAICADAYNNILYGTYSGLYWYNTQAQKSKKILNQPTIWNIQSIASANNYFVANGESKFGQLFFLKSNPTGASIEKIYPKNNETILFFGLAMAQDVERKGIWHGQNFESKTEIQFFHVETRQNHPFSPLVNMRDIKAMLVWQGLWVGSTDGLACFALPPLGENTLKTAPISLPNVLAQQSINTLSLDRHGNLWLGTNANGLFRYHPATGEYEQFTTNDGLPENSVFSILSEKKDSVLWIGTGNGLSRFDYGHRWFDNYFTKDGLTHDEFNTASAYQASDGTIYMGGQNGINYFHPDSFYTHAQAPRPYALFRLYGADPTVEQHFTLTRNTQIMIKPSTRLIETIFRSDDYIHAEQLHYRYRIPGVVDLWQYMGPSDKALFPRLPSGKYLLEAQVQSHRGMWSTAAYYTLNILPFWYETKWFRFLIVFSIVLLLYYLYQLRLRRLSNRFSFRQQVTHDLHDGLSSRMYLLRSLGTQVANPLLPEKERLKYLEKFDSVSQDTLLSLNSFLSTFEDEQTDVSQMFEQMEAFAHTYFAPLIPQVVVHRPPLPDTRKITTKTQHNLTNLYQEILTNMVKHTYCQSLHIHLICKKNTLFIIIQNHHTGYTTAKLSESQDNWGKESVSTRLKEIEATLSWSKPNDTLQCSYLSLSI